MIVELQCPALRFALFSLEYIVLVMKHILNIRATTLSLLFIIISASFTPAQAGLINSNQYYLLTGKIYADGILYSRDLDKWDSVGIAVDKYRFVGARSELDGSYSIRLPGDVRIVSFCRSTAGDLPYNSNSSHCSYLDTSLLKNKISDFPITYNQDIHLKSNPGRIITGGITSVNKKVNGYFETTNVKVYGEQGMLESMNVFGNKYQISIPLSATGITFCQKNVECIDLDPKSDLFKSSSALLTYNPNFKRKSSSKEPEVTLSGVVRDSNGKIFKGAYSLTERGSEYQSFHDERKKSFSGSYSIPFYKKATEIRFCTDERCTLISLNGKYPVGNASKNVIYNFKLNPDFLFKATVMSGVIYSPGRYEGGNNSALGNIEPGAYVKIKDRVTGKENKYYANSEGIYSALYSINYGGLTQCNAMDKCVDNSNLGYIDGTALITPNNNGFVQNWHVPSLPGEIYPKKNLAQSLNYEVKGKVFYNADGFQVRPSVLALGSTVKSLDSSGKVIKSVSVNSLGEFLLPLTENVVSFEVCNSFGFCYPQYPSLVLEQTFIVPNNYVDQKVNDLPKVKEVTSGTLTGTVKPFLTAKFNEAEWRSTVTTIYSYSKSGKVITTKVLPVNEKKSLKDFEFSLPIDLNVYNIMACIKLDKENYCSSNEINPVESKVFLMSPYPFPYQVFEVNKS